MKETHLAAAASFPAASAAQSSTLACTLKPLQRRSSAQL